MFLETLKLIVGPVTFTSANRAGQPDPLTAQEVVASLATMWPWCSTMVERGLVSHRR